MKGRMQNDLPWLFWSWCYAHRLELACKEALSSKLFKDIDELYFSDFTTYMRSPQRSAASWRMLYLSLKRFMNFPKTGNMPVRARGTRWINDKRNALQHVVDRLEHISITFLQWLRTLLKVKTEPA